MLCVCKTKYLDGYAVILKYFVHNESIFFRDYNNNKYNRPRKKENRRAIAVEFIWRNAVSGP
jgi:hypothetical protein